MLNKIIEFSLDNRFVIVILSIMLLIGGDNYGIEDGG